MFFLPWVIGGVVAVGAALLSGDDDDGDSQEQERIANLRAANQRRHLEAEARKRAAARKAAQRQKEVREEFDGIVSSKFRAFKMRSRIGATLHMTASECGFRDFKKDCAGMTALVKTAIADRFKEERAECVELNRQIKELDSVITELKRRTV